jgi:hypothetical protein
MSDTRHPYCDAYWVQRCALDEGHAGPHLLPFTLRVNSREVREAIENTGRASAPMADGGIIRRRPGGSWVTLREGEQIIPLDGGPLDVTITEANE